MAATQTPGPARGSGKVARLIGYAEFSGWQATEMAVAGGSEGFRLLHPEWPRLRVEIMAFTVSPYFRGRLLVDNRERAQFASDADLQSVLEWPDQVEAGPEAEQICVCCNHVCDPNGEGLQRMIGPVGNRAHLGCAMDREHEHKRDRIR